MTSLNVRESNFQAEDRSWLRGPHGVEPGTTPTVTLLMSLFTKADHYPNGFIPSGIVLGKVTASGVYGPYDPEASDGRETAAGLLFGSLTVDGDRAASGLVVHAFVDAARLPIKTGEGALDSDARADLKHIIFV